MGGLRYHLACVTALDRRSDEASDISCHSFDDARAERRSVHANPGTLNIQCAFSLIQMYFCSSPKSPLVIRNAKICSDQCEKRVAPGDSWRQKRSMPEAMEQRQRSRGHWLRRRRVASASDGWLRARP